MKIRFNLFVAALVMTLMSMTNISYGYHETQVIVINGRRIGPNQIMALEQLNGGPIPNGRYWINWNTGIWGYEGGPAMGILGDQRRRSPGYPSSPEYQPGGGGGGSPQFGVSGDGFTCIGGDCSFNSSP